MIVGCPRETYPAERRVALNPACLPLLQKAGLEMLIQHNAGWCSGFSDKQYEEKGAVIVPSRDDVFARADLVLMVHAPGDNPKRGAEDLKRVRPGQILIGICNPLLAPEMARDLAEKGATVFSLELMPRISRAQAMDVLSSQATVAGYRAALLAAERLTKIFPMLTTAAGALAPARVLVIGAGVAGLQAIATSRRLGAVVEAYDVRPAVKEQVESLGAKFVELNLEASDSEDKGGYAKEMDADFYERQRVALGKVIAECDVVITTAQIPGKRAPILITAEMAHGMKPGSVIVDIAAEHGGNCELTKPDSMIVDRGVSILGPVNLPSRVANHASQMYAKNISTFLLHLVKDGELKIDLEDQITRETMIARDGKVTNERILALLNGRAGEAAVPGALPSRA